MLKSRCRPICIKVAYMIAERSKEKKSHVELKTKKSSLLELTAVFDSKTNCEM